MPMVTVKVKLGNRSYPIIIGPGALGLLKPQSKKLDLGSSAYVVTNPFILARHGAKLRLALKGYDMRVRCVADTEKSKSIATAAQLMQDISRFDRKKRVFVVAFGGGVIGDLAGFLASVYRRGIPYVQVPTTLLAQVDSAIGGKTGVDLPSAKNLVGAFYQPRLVLSDTLLLASLSRRQLQNGLAEVIKYAVIRDPAFFSYLEDACPRAVAAEPGVLRFIVSRCSAIKADIVSMDEREEKGIRTILNFGHTIGHALEAASGFTRYGHGEAVALGMLVAAGISSRLGLIKESVVRRIEGLILSAGLTTVIKGVAADRILNAHYHDKKFIGKKNRFVLIAGIGRARIVENVPLAVIREALSERV